MQVHRLHIAILHKTGSEIKGSISHQQYQAAIEYHIDKNQLTISDSPLSELINQHQEQLKKILRSAHKSNKHTTNTISGVFIDDFPFLSEKDYDSYIRMNYSDKDLSIETSSTPLEHSARIIADGSYNDTKDRSAYAGFIILPGQEQIPYSASFEGGSSNLMELLGILEGIRRLRVHKQIQINTDSRYVIRGMIQWMHYWCHNDWQTAQSTPVCYQQYWQELYSLCLYKTIEIKWIKGHRGHQEHDPCHHAARQATQKMHKK